MKPAEYPTGHYLQEMLQLRIPEYQRPYSWDHDRHGDLWRDILSQYRRRPGATLKRHFMGALILEPSGADVPSGVTAFNVIDGQQRLLTLLVALSAIRDQIAFLTDRNVGTDDELALVSSKFAGSVKRVLPKKQDEAALASILEGKFVHEISSALFHHRLVSAYRFYRYQLWLGEMATAKSGTSAPPNPSKQASAPAVGSFTPWGLPARDTRSFDIPRLHGIVTNELSLLELQIDSGDEEAGVIFETMNAKNTPLAQFDLVRNSLFVRMPTRKDDFYREKFEPIEELLAKVSYSSKRASGGEQFMYEYLIGLGEDGVNRATLHRRWLNRVIDELGYQVTPELEQKFEQKFAQPLVENAWLYPIAVGNTRHARGLGDEGFSVSEEHQRRIVEIMAMTGGPAVPIILRALFGHQQSQLGQSELLEVLDSVQSFVVRWMLAGAGLTTLRGAFMTVARSLPDVVTVEAVQEALRSADWRTDQQVTAAVRTLDTKKLKTSIFPVLRGIERELSGISAHPLPYGNQQAHFSIEHIFPQTSNIGAWVAELGAWGADREEMDERKYVLGNLTAVTGYDNKKNGKRPFADKKALIAKTASLKLHDSFKDLEHWTPREIDARTELMAKAALSHWPRVE